MSTVGRRVLGPLVAGTTYRRFVHLLLGAVLLLPYLAVAALFVLSVRAGGLDGLPLVSLVAVAVAVGVGVAFVPGVRALEITAARALLDARIDDPAGPDDGPARRRAALWLLVNIVTGTAITLATLIVVPWTVGLLLAPWLPGSPAGWATAWAPLVGVLLPPALLYVVAGSGAALARLAPRLLGPSTAQRLAAQLARSREAERDLAHRNRLARELHDSVGHALTITTLQAGAAARVLDSDPAFVARALDAIAEAGRTALAELDHVLGILRDGVGDGPAPDLGDLDAMLDGARTAGVEVAAQVRGDAADLPAAVSQEAYRLVQESLTNALRHAGPVPVAVRVDVGADAVSLEITNGVRRIPPPELQEGHLHATSAQEGGLPATPRRGVAGMRERVAGLGGELSAGPDVDGWRVLARLPFRDRMGA